MRLTRLTYVSRRLDRTSEGIERIGSVSQWSNDAHGISGALVATHDRFLQLLEGPCAPLGHCFERILRDERHERVRIISAGDVHHRLFDRWSLRVIDLLEASPVGRAPSWLNALRSDEDLSQNAAEELFRRIAVTPPVDEAESLWSSPAAETVAASAADSSGPSRSGLGSWAADAREPDRPSVRS